jgi:hypothetical protein
VFLGLLDPDPDSLVRGMDSKKNLDFYCSTPQHCFCGIAISVVDPDPKL